jgi:hypothetical protein
MLAFLQKEMEASTSGSDEDSGYAGSDAADEMVRVKCIAEDPKVKE